MNKISCRHSFGKWTVRLNGYFIDEFFFESSARRLAMRIAAALGAIVE